MCANHRTIGDSSDFGTAIPLGEILLRTMASASKKRRRRREREKRAEDLLKRARAISLVDLASPVPTTDTPISSEKRQSLTNQNSNVSIRNEVSAHNSSPVDRLASPQANFPEKPSWKRIDFVLPRVHGQKRFVFDRQGKPEECKENGEITKHISESETIEDILFPNKQRKESSPNNSSDLSLNQDMGSRKRAKLDEKNDRTTNEAQHRKLEDAFESVHQATRGETIRSSADVPMNVDEKTPPTVTRKIRKDPLLSDEKNKAAPTEDDLVEIADEIHRKKKSINVAQPSPRKISGITVREAVRDKRGLRPRANSTDGELNLPRGGLCDERMILEAHKWNMGRKLMNQIAPRGFHNLGNTCFLNATLQCLTYLPPLCQTLLALSSNKTGIDHKGGNRNTPQGQRITSSLCNTFQQAHGFNNNSPKGGGPFSPKRVVNHLPNIGSCGSRNGYKFRLGRQEDAHEFLVHLLDAMNDGELRAAGIYQNVSGWRDRLPVSRLDETTFVHRIFGGYFRSQVRCREKNCNYKSNTYDPFLDLSLEVSKKSSTSVLQALSEFTRKETLDAENKWKCSGCKKYVCATKQLTVFRPPLSLCIQLKRFAFASSFGLGQKFPKYSYGYGGVGGGGSKITKPIDFPGTLLLPLSDNRSCQYTLTGIVIHVGGSSQSGHYTAYVKKPLKNGTSQWYHIDDSYVQPVSEKTVLKQKDAYLLFYCRTEVKLEFPDPPSRSMSASEATEFGRSRARARADSFPSESSVTPRQIKTDEESRRSVLRNENLSKQRAQIQDIASKYIKNERKETMHQFKTTTHPLNDTKPFQAAASKPEKNEDVSVCSSPSGAFHSVRRTNEQVNENREKKFDTLLNNDSGDSSDDTSSDDTSSDSESSVGTNSSVDSDSCSEKEDPADYNAGVDNLPFNALYRSAEMKEYGPSALEADSVGKYSSSNSRKLLENQRDLTCRKESTKFDIEVNSKAESFVLEEPSCNRKNGEKSCTSSLQTPKRPGDTGKFEKNGDDETSSNVERTTKHSRGMESSDCSQQKSTNLTSRRAQVVQNNIDSRGKLKVTLGPRKRKIWRSATSALPSKGSNFQLLGNMKISQWEEDDNCDNYTAVESRTLESVVHHKRKNITENIEKQNRSRKRKMHLDRWDSHLDQGKLKKVKTITKNDSHIAPKKNIFQRIQSGVQRMSRGKPKGHFRRKFNKKKGKF